MTYLHLLSLGRSIPFKGTSSDITRPHCSWEPKYCQSKSRFPVLSQTGRGGCIVNWRCRPFARQVFGGDQSRRSGPPRQAVRRLVAGVHYLLAAHREGALAWLQRDGADHQQGRVLTLLTASEHGVRERTRSSAFQQTCAASSDGFDVSDLDSVPPFL
jgi:hypothetical protein